MIQTQQGEYTWTAKDHTEYIEVSLPFSKQGTNYQICEILRYESCVTNTIVDYTSSILQALYLPREPNTTIPMEDALNLVYLLDATVIDTGGGEAYAVNPVMNWEKTIGTPQRGREITRNLVLSITWSTEEAEPSSFPTFGWKIYFRQILLDPSSMIPLTQSQRK